MVIRGFVDARLISPLLRRDRSSMIRRSGTADGRRRINVWTGARAPPWQWNTAPAPPPPRPRPPGRLCAVLACTQRRRLPSDARRPTDFTDHRARSSRRRLVSGADPPPTEKRRPSGRGPPVSVRPGLAAPAASLLTYLPTYGRLARTNKDPFTASYLVVWSRTETDWWSGT